VLIPRTTRHPHFGCAEPIKEVTPMARSSLRYVFVVVTAFSLLALAPTAVAQTSVSVHERTTFIRPAGPPCPEGEPFCGTVTLSPFGDARLDYEVTSFTPVSSSCADVTGVLHFTVLASGDALDLATTSTVCFPGNSANTPDAAHAHSFGNPFTENGSWTVTSGTGLFTGATGAGTFILSAAGADVTFSLSGTLNLVS
jgi:hypothetical protein